MPVALADAFAFFADARNLEAITPPWLRFGILTPAPVTMRPGAVIDYRLNLHGVPVRWRTRIVIWEPPRRFVDVQLHGPFGAWEHTHTFESRDEGTLIHDLVRYRMPLGPLGMIAHRILVARDLRRVFDFRAAAVARLLAQSPGVRPATGGAEAPSTPPPARSTAATAVPLRSRHRVDGSAVGGASHASGDRGRRDR